MTQLKRKNQKAVQKQKQPGHLPGTTAMTSHVTSSATSSATNNVTVIPTAFAREKGVRIAKEATGTASGSTRQSGVSVAPRLKKANKTDTNFRLFETEDATLGLVMAARSIKNSLQKGETVAIVSHVNPQQLIQKLSLTGKDYQSSLEQGKLIIFSYQPTISSNLSMSTNYQSVFGELSELAEKPLDRIVIMGVDLLLNLESQNLAYTSVSKFIQAASEQGCQITAQYSRNQSLAHDRLDAACSSLIGSYYVMQRSNTKARYTLQQKNIAC
jgi:hypothetical protein